MASPGSARRLFPSVGPLMSDRDLEAPAARKPRLAKPGF